MVLSVALCAAEKEGPGRKEIPSVYHGGVVNAAGFVPAPDNFVAPLSIISIFGEDLALRTAQVGALNGQGRLPDRLGGVQVTIGGLTIPLFFVSPGQINAQVPRALAPRERPWTMRIVREGLVGPDAEVSVRAVAPGLFPVVVHRDFTVVGREPLLPSTPARPGDLVILFGTGFGPTVPTADTGELPPGPATIVMPSSVWIEDRMISPDRVLYIGQTPGLAGLQQVNVLLPEDLAAGDPQIFVEVAGRRTQSGVRVAVDRSGP